MIVGWINFNLMDLSISDRNTFHERGILSFKGLVSKHQCAAVKGSILKELDRLKLREKGKLASSRISKLPFFQQVGRLGQMIKMGSELDALFSEDLITCMNSLANATLNPSNPQLLLSFPHKEDWSLSNLNWHLDLSVPNQDKVPGIQAFVLIEDVLPRGGATLALAGSHKWPYSENNTIRSAHGLLRQHPPERFLQPQKVDGIEIFIVEMAGCAGDVFLMDMRVLHSPSINATKNIRMMVTKRYTS